MTDRWEVVATLKGELRAILADPGRNARSRIKAALERLELYDGINDSPDERERRRAWCKRNFGNPLVRAWIAANPPPKEWQGSRLEWAYTEMLGAPE